MYIYYSYKPKGCWLGGLNVVLVFETNTYNRNNALAILPRGSLFYTLPDFPGAEIFFFFTPAYSFGVDSWEIFYLRTFNSITHYLFLEKMA